MARNLYVICGSRMMERYQLIDGISKIDKSAVAVQSKLAKEVYLDKKLLRQVRRILLNQHTDGNERLSLLDLIEQFSTARCEDPKDKIYGLRGLAIERDAIQVEYSRGMLYTILSISTSMQRLRNVSGLHFYCYAVMTLLRRVPLAVGDVLSGLAELHENAHDDSNHRRSTQDKGFKSLINSFVFSSEQRLVTTNTQFLIEAGYYCTRCILVTNPKRASYLYCKLPPAIGCLVYPQYGVPDSSECLAIITDQVPGAEGRVVEIGVLLEETLYIELAFEKAKSLQELRSAVHDHEIFFRKTACVESWSRFFKLFLPGGFEVCVMDGKLHCSPIVLLAVTTWQHYGWHQQIWTTEEAEQVLKMIEGWVEGNADLYTRQRLCCCLHDTVNMTKEE